MITLDLCQHHYQILLIIYQTEFIIYLDDMTTKDEKLIFRCFECKKNYEKDFNKELIKRFANIYEFLQCRHQ